MRSLRSLFIQRSNTFSCAIVSRRLLFLFFFTTLIFVSLYFRSTSFHVTRARALKQRLLCVRDTTFPLSIHSRSIYFPAALSVQLTLHDACGTRSRHYVFRSLLKTFLTDFIFLRYANIQFTSTNRSQTPTAFILRTSYPKGTLPVSPHFVR